jgi:hypothetical protein
MAGLCTEQSDHRPLRHRARGSHRRRSMSAHTVCWLRPATSCFQRTSPCAWSLSLHELVEIKRAITEIQPRTYPTPDNRRLQGSTEMEVVFRHDRLGILETRDAAVAFRAACISSVRDGERKAHFACIPTNPDGHVAIKLSGVSGAGCWSKVDRSIGTNSLSKGHGV